MRKWTRNIHLLIGVLTTPFLLMYALSAVQMAHSKWFKLHRTTVKTMASVRAAEAIDGRAVTRILMARKAVLGEINRIDSTKNGYRIRVARPGATYEIVYDASTEQANIVESRADAVFMLNRLHHIAGINHQYGWLNVWGWVLGLVGVLLFGLAATGIYLWFKMHGELAIGLVLLALSFGYSVALLYSLRAT